MRGIAVLFVVIFHAGLNLPGGFTGVDVFFVISGFVIGGVLLAELEETGRIDPARFYARRVRRLLPALALMLSVVALAGVLLAPVGGDHEGGITGILASLFSANIYLLRNGAGYFAADQALNPFLHTWTLAVEEQFYVLFPTLLALSWVTGRRRRRRSRQFSAALVIAVVSLISLAWALELSSGPPGGATSQERFSFYGSPTRAWEFGFGALLVLLSPVLRRAPVALGTAAGIGGLGAIVVGAFSIQNTSSYPNLGALLPTGGACALLAAGTMDKEGVSRLVAVRPLVWVGDLSYSWYLWHWPFIVFAVALWPTQRVPVSTAAAVLSLLPAWASLRYVENPIRRNRRLAGRRVLALAAVCVALPILACLGFIVGSGALASEPALAAWRSSQEAHLDHRRGCDSGQPFGSQPPRCSWTVRHARGSIALVGDSYAGQVAEAVVRGGNLDRFDVTVATFPACPFLDVRIHESVPTETQCRHYYSRGLQALLRLRPSLVVTSFRADHYTEEPQIELAVGAHGRLVNGMAAKESAIERGLASTLHQLNSRGVPVLLVDPVPWYPSAIGDCAALRILSGSCPTVVSRHFADMALAGPMRINRLAVRRARLSVRLNLEDRLCSRTRCADMRHGVVTYRDFDHISVTAARAMTHLFERAISRFAVKHRVPKR